MIDVDVSLRIGNFDLKIVFANNNGITALFGQSGAGKSLTFSLLSGLRRPDHGHIIVGNRVLADVEKAIFIPPYRRRIGLVFQESNLFPHMSVKQNLLFGRWLSGQAHRQEINFEAVVETLGVGKLLKRRPASLSGGERQRVAIGRALLSAPELLLFDEPLAALDMDRKLEILPLIEQLRDEFKVPMVYVSHAIEEVVRLASYVVIIERGRVKAAGSPEQVFGNIAVQLAENKYDRASVLSMQVTGENAAYGLTKLERACGVIWLTGPAGPLGREIRVIVKATDVILTRDPPPSASVRSVLAGQIRAVELEGPLAIIDVSIEGAGQLFSMVSRHAVDELKLAAGVPIYALIKTAAVDERKASMAPF